jgi:hypothetical protein
MFELVELVGAEIHELSRTWPESSYLIVQTIR